MNKFGRGQIIVYAENGAQYCVISTPHRHHILSGSGEPFYSVRSYGTDQDHYITYISQSEVEDGRFIEQPPANP